MLTCLCANSAYLLIKRFCTTFKRQASNTAAAVKPEIKPIQKPYGPDAGAIQSVRPKIKPKISQQPSKRKR